MKATGLDGLGRRILKLAAEILSPSFAALINKSLNTGQFPKQLKMAKVFPIFKSGQKTDTLYYRPISILPTLSKIFEKHVNKHTMDYLNKYRLIHECQSGFSHKHSCQTALVKLVDQWINCVDQGDLVGTMFIDFRKVFDMVDHSLLISKLSARKFNTSAIKWFTSYLDTRLQAIKNEHGLSEFSQTLSGVPQDFILGRTLFLLFINPCLCLSNIAQLISLQMIVLRIYQVNLKSKSNPGFSVMALKLAHGVNEVNCL